jgi:hypothetical protein
LFFPVVPGDEENSWKEFYSEALERFFKGAFAGDYEDRLLKRFESSLPEDPPWPVR